MRLRFQQYVNVCARRYPAEKAGLSFELAEELAAGDYPGIEFTVAGFSELTAFQRFIEVCPKRINIIRTAFA